MLAFQRQCHRRRHTSRRRSFIACATKFTILALVPAFIFVCAFFRGVSGPKSVIDDCFGAKVTESSPTAGFNADSFITQFVHDQAPLTPYATDLVASLRSMDVDLVASTAPLTRAVKNRTVLIYPIGFSIPPSYVRAVVPPKGQALATVIPGLPSTYKYMPRAGNTAAELVALEREYYADMERSLFGLTWKKAGWDCLRHLELLASGSVPLFTDIDRAPRGAVAFLPKRVLSMMLRFPGIRVTGSVPGLPKGSGEVGLAPDPGALPVSAERSQGGPHNIAIGSVTIDPVMYSVVAMALLDYTRRHLTTPAMAAHLLKTMGFHPPHCQAMHDSGLLDNVRRDHRRMHLDSRARRSQSKVTDGHAHVVSPARSTVCLSKSLRVLYLSLAKDTNDYMADTLAHGLVTLLGQDAVVQHHRRDVLYATPGKLGERALARSRSSLYGFGFSYASTLFDLRDADVIKSRAASTEAELRRAIAAHEFDVVIFSLIHRGRPPLMDAVCAAYPPERVAAVHGHDTPPTEKDLEVYTPCAGYFFAREAM